VKPVVESLAEQVGVKTACEALGVPRSSRYAARRPHVVKERAPAPPPPRTLSSDEKQLVRQTLNSQRFADQAPREVYAALLDEGVYHCSVPTMYRILAENQELRERRNQLRHPIYAKPHLVATGPNQVWTWDITKLPGPAKWAYFCLYVVLDLFSRFVVGWLIAAQESAALAQQLVTESYVRQGLTRDQLSIHSDRGGPMIAGSLTALFDGLGITPSLARPRTPDDNPYSEAQFKTVKYHPTFPDQFGCLLDARTWGQQLFRWYNYEHHHTALGLMTPAAVHFGQAPALFLVRQQVLATAYATHPERFVRGVPQPPALPSEVWINRLEPAEKLRCDTGERH
jgi:transposase InsO family protein